eukprot:scaffold135891_cov25-Tisochrysis_lutea.AAC.1
MSSNPVSTRFFTSSHPMPPAPTTSTCGAGASRQLPVCRDAAILPTAPCALSLPFPCSLSVACLLTDEPAPFPSAFSFSQPPAPCILVPPTAPSISPSISSPPRALALNSSLIPRPPSQIPRSHSPHGPLPLPSPSLSLAFFSQPPSSADSLTLTLFHPLSLPTSPRSLLSYPLAH